MSIITNEMKNGYKEVEYYDDKGNLKAVKYFRPGEEIPTEIPNENYGKNTEDMVAGGIIE